jgi:hypothetical protein
MLLFEKFQIPNSQIPGKIQLPNPEKDSAIILSSKSRGFEPLSPPSSLLF